MTDTRRPARYQPIYVNGVPVWECGGCGDQRPVDTPHEQLTDHEQSCGQWLRSEERP